MNRARIASAVLLAVLCSCDHEQSTAPSSTTATTTHITVPSPSNTITGFQALQDAPAAPDPVETQTPTTARPSTTTSSSTSETTRTDAYYANCDAARAADAAPILRGEPGYRPALDRDDDGIACENDSTPAPETSVSAESTSTTADTLPASSTTLATTTESTAAAVSSTTDTTSASSSTSSTSSG